MVEPEPPVVVEPGGTTPEGMVLIPAGEFQMGSSHIDEVQSVQTVHVDVSAQPVHTVHIDAFYMDKYEVTKAQYVEFIKAKGSSYAAADSHIFQEDGTYYVDIGYENHPVGGVTWYDAMAYAAWVGKRLPTEAEWEKAARGGLNGKIYPWGDSKDTSKANYAQPIGGTTVVGTYPPNGYGLYDMAGNVWEWCLDEYNENFYKIPQSRSPNPIGGSHSIEQLIQNPRIAEGSRVLRGGSWGDPDIFVRVATRGNRPPTHSLYNNVGFRCVRDVSP